MTVDEGRNAILTAFAVMNKDQRKAILQFLKISRKKLDINFPNGVPTTK